MVTYPSRSSSYFLKTSVILFKLMQDCTKRSKLMPRPWTGLRSRYVLYKMLTKGGDSRYPKAVIALEYSCSDIRPLLSSSNFSKSVRQAARKRQRFSNSWKVIVGPCGWFGGELVNMRIRDVIVLPSKGVKSAFTRAEPSSVVVNDPVLDEFAARNRGCKSTVSGSCGAGVLP
jgi:hypothetical protein